MTIDFSSLWHVGVLVDDLASGQDQLAFGLGMQFTSTLDRDVTVTVNGCDQCSRVRWSASLGGAPHFELIQAAEGIWASPRTGGHPLHHVAYWSSDLETDARQMQQHGFVLEAVGRDDEQRIRFVYLLGPSGMRIELGAEYTKNDWLEWTSGGDYSLSF